MQVADGEEVDACLTLKVLRQADPQRLARMTSQELRQDFLLDDLFLPGRLQMAHTDPDRCIVGAALPLGKSLLLEGCEFLRTRYFTQRREVGIINLGGPGLVHVGQAEYSLQSRDGLYAGSGPTALRFSTVSLNDPAVFYFVSYPAHASYPTQLIPRDSVESVRLGRQENANQRILNRYIHADGVRSCQLVMGLTQLERGSVWNTMPVHTHERRSEVYLYFDLPEDGLVVHCFGLPTETRHVMVRNRQAVCSPGWSIHSGVGTSHYAFIWAMGGENQDFADMDPVPMEVLG